jgi:hypothetical protein
MTKVRPTGFSLPPGFGVQWEFADSDRNIARKAIAFLENRRLLFGDRHYEDELECVRSAIQIRDKLSELIPLASEGGGVEQSLRAVRAACTQFVNKAGPGASNFRGLHGGTANLFGQALGELSSLVGIQVALLADRYKLAVEEGLMSIFPPPDGQDLSWIPGFDDRA